MEVVIIEDNVDLAENLQTFLRALGFRTGIALTGASGLREVVKHAPRVVLLDHGLPDTTGLKLLPKLLAADPHIAVIMITAAGNAQLAVDAIKAGAIDYMPKPVKLDQLDQTIQKLLHRPNPPALRPSLHLVTGTGGKPAPSGGESSPTARARHIEAVQHTRGTTDAIKERIKGSSLSIRNLRRLVRKFIQHDTDTATGDLNMLITGEGGTGKELTARLMHDNGQRHDAPFIVINCAGIPDAKFEPELARHLDGLGDAGRSGAATLFLDEVGCLSAAAQAVVLHLIESSQSMQTGIRIIAASAMPLEEFVRSGRFRGDLYYRLRRLWIHVPALRDRENDACMLADYFLRLSSERMGRDMPALTAHALRAIRAYGWPGNVRELQMRIERVVAIGNSSRIDAADLGLSPGPYGAIGITDSDTGFAEGSQSGTAAPGTDPGSCNGRSMVMPS
jgi:two-component system response regulator AtoC